VTLPQEKGQELERQIADFFASNGYTVARNAILEGRSGGRHEIDVLAEKSDGITTFRLLIECKAWGSPIEKDVLAKLDYVLRDLGVNKGIVVALQGGGRERSSRPASLALSCGGLTRSRSGSDG
jgi:Holliday junction resolvase